MHKNEVSKFTRHCQLFRMHLIQFPRLRNRMMQKRSLVELFNYYAGIQSAVFLGNYKEITISVLGH